MLCDGFHGDNFVNISSTVYQDSLHHCGISLLLGELSSIAPGTLLLRKNIS